MSMRPQSIFRLNTHVCDVLETAHILSEVDAYISVSNTILYDTCNPDTAGLITWISTRRLGGNLRIILYLISTLTHKRTPPTHIILQTFNALDF